MNQTLQTEFIRLSRNQRAAYFAWQNAPAGIASLQALDAYCEASKAQRDFEAKHLGGK